MVSGFSELGRIQILFVSTSFALFSGPHNRRPNRGYVSLFSEAFLCARARVVLVGLVGGTDGRGEVMRYDTEY